MAKGWQNEQLVTLELVHHDDDTPATPASFYFSFLDVGNEESLKVYGTAFEFSAGSNLGVTDERSSSGWVRFDAQVCGCRECNARCVSLPSG